MTEENDEKSESYEFTNCIVDADRRELSMANEAVTMQPKAFELLLYLIRNRHRAVDKNELPHKVWSDCIQCPKFPDCNEEAMILDGCC